MPGIKVDCILIRQCSDFPQKCGECRENQFLKISYFTPLEIEEKPNSTNVLDDLRKLEFVSPGTFYYACQHHLKKSKKEVDLIITGLDPDEPDQCKKAWQKVIEKFSRPEKAG